MRCNTPGSLVLKDKALYPVAFFAGAVLPLAFAPLALFPLAFISPAVLFWLWLDASPKQAAKVGFAFGLGFFGVGVSWVYIAIHVYGHTMAPVAAFMTLLFVAFLALLPALQGYTSVRLLRPYRDHPAYERLALLLILPTIWALFEWLRGWVLTGFPWLNLGYSHIDSPLAGAAPWVGVYGISWLSVLISGLLVLMIRQQVWRIKAGVGLVVILSGSFLLGQVEWTEAIDKPITVSIVQGNVPQMTKWDPKMIQFRLDTYADLTRKHWDSDLIFWPENSISVFYHDIKDHYFVPLEKEARASNTDLIVGLPYMDMDTRQYYSSLVSMGKTPGVYHKRHLVPFGEYVPLGFLIRGLVNFFDLPMSSFSPGAKRQDILRAAGQPLATSICYEDAFGEEVINFLPEATLLLNGSNNAWYGNSLAAHQHLQIARMRTIETGRMLIRATTNGISAFVDHRGKIISRSPQFETFVLTDKVQPRTGATPYVRLGNYPVVIGMLVILAFLLWDGRHRSQPN